MIVREAAPTWWTEYSFYAYQNSERIGGFYTAHPGPIILRAYAQAAARGIGVKDGTYNPALESNGGWEPEDGMASNYMPVAARWPRPVELAAPRADIKVCSRKALNSSDSSAKVGGSRTLAARR